MNLLTKTFLILLRLAIGWHFLVEGYDKIHSHYLGVTETNRPWTSEFYLREANGPLGDYFRSQAGDLDRAALERLTVIPLSAGQDRESTPFRQRLPQELEVEWKAFVDRFQAHYRLDQAQAEAVRAKLDECKDQTVRWLLTGKKPVKKVFPSGTTVNEETTEQRIQEYRAKLEALREIQDVKLPLFGRDVEKEKLRAAKADANRLRSELLADLKGETDKMKLTLRGVLTKEQMAQEPLQEPVPARRVEGIDLLTRYGLTAVGVCLLLGLFTRMACLGGAGFLLLFYLTMPPFPWLPENLRAEGHYLFVNKNLIEMLALLTLATTPSGRWVGLDGLVRSLNPMRSRKYEPREAASRTASERTPSYSAKKTEPTHGH